eukprot:s11433_g1.t1
MLAMKQVAEQTLSFGNTDKIKQCKDDVVRATQGKTWVEYMENLSHCEGWATKELIDFVSARRHLLGDKETQSFTIFGYGFVNLSDRALKENVRAIPEEELQQIFDAVEPQLYDRIDGGKEQIGFVAQDVQASGKLGATMCKTKTLDGRELMALDYQKLSVVLWGVVKKLQKRVEALEKKKKRKGDSD